MENERIQMLEQKIQEYETIISEMAAPIIPSIVPETILVPITGLIRTERFEKIRNKLLTFVQNKDIETAIVDLTDITGERLEGTSLEEVGREIHQLSTSLALMGVKTVYVGLTSELVKKMVLNGIVLEAPTFATFQTALKYLMKQKGLEFKKVEK